MIQARKSWDRSHVTLGRSGLGTVLLALILMVAACSLPVDGEVQALEADDHPDVVFGSPTTSTTAPPPDEATRLRLFFAVGQEGLGDVLRPLADPTIAEVLTALQAPPSEAEADAYTAEFERALRTALPPGLNPTARARDGASLLAIDVADEGNLRTMPNEAPAEAELVFSQIVCTLTNLTLLSGDTITEVEFYDSAGRIPIVDANRSLIVDERASASDFNDCETVRDRAQAQFEDQSTSTSTTSG